MLYAIRHANADDPSFLVRNRRRGFRLGHLEEATLFESAAEARSVLKAERDHSSVEIVQVPAELLPRSWPSRVAGPAA